jgi:hypothetical protein
MDRSLRICNRLVSCVFWALRWALSPSLLPTTPCAFEPYANLSIVLTIVHCDGTSILSLHNTNLNASENEAWITRYGEGRRWHPISNHELSMWIALYISYWTWRQLKTSSLIGSQINFVSIGQFRVYLGIGLSKSSAIFMYQSQRADQLATGI